MEETRREREREKEEGKCRRNAKNWTKKLKKKLGSEGKRCNGEEKKEKKEEKEKKKEGNKLRIQ